MKTSEEEGVRVHSLAHNILRVRGVCLSSGIGTRTNTQAKVQDEINLHNKKEGQLVQVEWEWCNKFNKDNLKHKLYTTCNLWEEALIPSLEYILCFSTRTRFKCHFSR
jgi:hypothetical protein